MYRVAILMFEHTALFELGCAVELFALPRPEFKQWYDTEVVTFSKQQSTVAGGLQLKCKTVKNLDQYDLLIIPNWSTNIGSIDKTMSRVITQFYQQGKRIISFCSGAFLLAQLGILNQRVAITHWRYANEFKKQFPRIHYVEDVLYVYDGQIGCSAGSSAAIDLGLEVIRQDFGYEAANAVARRLVLSAHRKGGQSQFSELDINNSTSQFSKALDWAMSHMTSTLRIDDLAEKANMSRRTFDRKFKASLNITPKEWITYQRLNLAKSLLEKHTFGIEKIAELSGFDNATTMRHHFRKEFGVSPSLHRNQFKAVSIQFE